MQICINFLCGILSTFYRFKVARIAVQRSEEARILFRSNVCLLDPEMLVFLDESGFVSFQLLFYNLFYSSMIFHKSRFFRLFITFLDRRLSRTYGHSLVGKRATVKRQAQNWGPCITAIPVICTEGMIEVGIRARLMGQNFTSLWIKSSALTCFHLMASIRDQWS